MYDKADNWAFENNRGPPVHQLIHRTSGLKIQSYF